MILPIQNKRVVVAMSGGVDSSVCAYLLKEEGYEVIGVTIKTWSAQECRTETAKGCCSIRDIDDARAVARNLDIPYYVLDLSENFKEKVIDYFTDEYLLGRTPNPCIECNNHIKFGLLRQKAIELQAAFVATGHYARKGFNQDQGRYFVREGLDASKDQSYVLFGLSQEQLANTLLPIGDLDKAGVRAIAQRLGLRIFDKPDSQEICFVKSHYGDFLKQSVPERLPGEGFFVDSSGRLLGKHEGSHLYTIGQRKRLPNITQNTPFFVTGIDAKKNEVQIGLETELLMKEMLVGRTNWQLTRRTGPIHVKIRSHQPKVHATLLTVDDSSAKVQFQVPQKAVTPGQAAVFYDGDAVLGGGWIQQAFSAV